MFFLLRCPDFFRSFWTRRPFLSRYQESLNYAQIIQNYTQIPTTRRLVFIELLLLNRDCCLGFLKFHYIFSFHVEFASFILVQLYLFSVFSTLSSLLICVLINCECAERKWNTEDWFHELYQYQQFFVLSS